MPHSHLIFQLRPSAVFLLFWFSNVGYFLFPKSCFVFPRLFFVFPKSGYIFPKSCHYGCLFLIRHLTEYFLSPSGDLGIGLVWDNNPTPPDRSFLVRLLKSSSNWTKLSMRGPQLFSGWYQMILGVFRCSQLFSDVFSWVVTFIESLPVQCITTPCAHILWSSLYEVWQDQDASVGNQIGPNSTT